MKKTQLLIWFTIGFSTLSMPAFAQTSAYTLQQCVDYAVKNHLNVKSSQYDADIAKAKRKETLGTGLPQINGNVQMMHNDPLRRFFFQNPAPGPQTGVFPNVPSEAPGAVLSQPNFFQLPSSGDASLQATQTLFSGAYIVGVQGAKVYQQLADQTVLKTKIDVVESVSKAYWMSVVLTERLKVVEASINRTDTNLRQVKGSFKSGFAENIDVNRQEVAYNNFLAEKQKLIASLDLSMLALKYRMGMPLNESIELSETLKDASTKYNDSDAGGNANYENRIDYQMSKSNLLLNKSERKLNVAQGLPALSLFGNLGLYNQTVDFNYLTKANPWYHYGNFGLNLTAPIITGGSRHFRVQQSSIKIKQSEAKLKYLEQSIDFEVANANVTYSNALKTVEINNKNMTLAQQVVKVANAKYKAGLGSNLELTVAENGLKEAQANYYISVSDALLARIDLDKAKGILYNVK